MSFADNLRAIARSARAIPGQMGIRPHTVELVVSTWDGAYTGDGIRSDDVTPIAESGGQPPKVRWLNDDEIVTGNVSSGTVEIGPITSAGGITMSELRLEDRDNGVGRFLRVTGPKHPTGGIYRITEIRADRAIHWMLRASPVESNGSE